MLTLSQLITSRTKEQLRAQEIQALQGVGFVLNRGVGTGKVTASGVAVLSTSVVLEIVTDGEPGTATFKISLDNGASWGAIQIVPLGAYVLANTGCILNFQPGPSGSGISFCAGDRFSLALSVPTFPVTAWQPGTLPLTLLENDAVVLEDLDALIAAIANGGLLEYATGAWLDLLAWNVYDLKRGSAVATRGFITLTDAANAGPFNISAGQLWTATGLGLRFNNITTGIIPQGGTVGLLFQAESPGAQYNVASGAIANLLTPLPGVTCTNLANWFALSGCIQGADSESDTVFRARSKGRWSALGIGATAATYDYWARTATAEPGQGEERVTRTRVRTSTALPGQVEVYLAGDAGPSNALTVAKVDSFIEVRMPLTSSVLVQPANSVAIPITGSVTVLKANRAASEAAALSALSALFQSIQIGGNNLVSGHGVSREAIIAAIAGQAGVLDADISSPSADVILSDTQVASLGTVSLNWIEV